MDTKLSEFKAASPQTLQPDVTRRAAAATQPEPVRKNKSFGLPGNQERRASRVSILGGQEYRQEFVRVLQAYQGVYRKHSKEGVNSYAIE